MWATIEKIREFLKECFDVEFIPCYSWFTQVLGIIDSKSFNDIFTKRIMGLVGEIGNATMSLDGKIIRSTGKMQHYENPLHIVSAQITELGVTIGQTAVEGKSNEIPAVQRSLDFLDVKGCVVVADALNCQKDTGKKVIKGGGDYLFSAKDNQPTLKAEISDYVQDVKLRATMDVITKSEKNRDRIETRTAYTTTEIDWLSGRDE